MKTKQVISLALVLALLVTVITGCGTKDGSSTNNNEESTSVVYAEMKENEEDWTEELVKARSRQKQGFINNIFKRILPTIITQ